MLNKLRGFSNTKLAGVLIAIIIIPFVFWGMGSVFSGGNTNNIAKVNNETISTQDFMKYVNQTMMDSDYIKKNINNNVIENIISSIVSKKLLDMEINDLNILLPDKSLVEKIKSNEVFLDDKNNFSRIKYEKFLLENNLTAPDFEIRFKNEELKKNLFYYIGGGIKSPYFLNNKIYINQTKEINIDYINLETVYNTETTESEINNFINENEENLKEELIDLSYVKITPTNLIEIDDFNAEFFKKIDDIENLILNGENIDEIVKIYNLQLIKKDNYIYKNENDEILKEIYNNRNKKNTQIIEKNDFYLVYKIKKISSKLPDQNSSEFLKFIKNNLYLKNVYEFNQDLLAKIQEKKFKDDDFNEFIKKGLTVEKITINSINDDSIFDINSIKLLYTIPKNNFTLINDKENNIFIAKIIETKTKKILNNSDKFKDYLYKSDLKIKNNLYSSYDLFLNNKYQIKVYRNTLDRIKNYFR